MNERIEVGKINILEIERVTLNGIYLKSQNGEEVLLPNAYVKKTMQANSEIKVFVYTDSEDRLVATTLVPYVYLYEFADLEIVDVTSFGAFVDIGLSKDILVPKNKQRSSFEIGGTKVLQLQLDERTNRLIASEKFDLIDYGLEDYKINDEVEIIICAKTPLGYKVIVDNSYNGLVYHNEIFEKVEIGSKKRAYVKNIRDDNKLDISLQKIGERSQEDKICQILSENNGEMNFTYKSDAEDIKEKFSVSKKTFKASLTKLIKDNKIELTSTSIKIIES